MPFIENFYEFQDRQNCDSIRDQQGSIRYANGAIWVPAGGSPVEGQGYEPPRETQELARLQQQFHRLWLAAAERRFENLRGTLAAQTEISEMGAGPCPSSDDIEHLRCLANDIAKYRNTLAKIDQQLAPVRTPRRLNIREQQAEQAARAKQELANIHI